MAAGEEARADGQRRGRSGDPCVMVICGASGDLTRRKLIPALYNLAQGGLLPANFAVVGFSRETTSTQAFRDLLAGEFERHATGPVDATLRDRLLSRVYYQEGDFRDPAAYARLEALLSQVDAEQKTPGNHLFYMATPPAFFTEIALQLGAAGLLREEEGRWRRVVIEKPFGHDLESSRALNRALLAVMQESQIYRIDHYLGKETVQNLMVFRFANGIFEPIWNRRYVDHVQITVAEGLGVEGRGGYYEEAGALRDIVQNHMLQILAFTAMEPPISFSATAVRDDKAKVLHAIQPLLPEEVLTRTVRGQYGRGRVGGADVPGYREEPNVAAGSNTETFVALKLSVDNWRWADVPFYLRTGKRLAARSTEVVVQFRRPPFRLFRGISGDGLPPNQLVLNIQPNEGIALSFGAKIPGPDVRLGQVDMSFQYDDYFGSRPSTGYETLLYDCMIGDATLFQREDMVEAGWDIVAPILDVWKALPARNFPNYAAGSMGPKDADDLLARDGRAWRGSDDDPGGRHRRD